MLLSAMGLLAMAEQQLQKQQLSTHDKQWRNRLQVHLIGVTNAMLWFRSTASCNCFAGGSDCWITGGARASHDEQGIVAANPGGLL